MSRTPQFSVSWEEYIDNLIEENKKLQEKVNTYSEEYGKLREENSKQKAESEELRAWLREKLPLALLKEYMEKFEWVDLKNV